MALIKCPECGKDVSDTIENCIHCGYKLKQNDSTKTTIIKCAKCGKENHNTNNFCNYCGSYLSKDINTTEVTEGKIDGNLLSQDNKNETPSQDNNPIDSKTTISNKLIIDVVNELPPFVKFIIAILGTIVALLLISLVFSSLIKCSYCTDGFIPCENCTDGKITCETCEGNMTVECENCNDEFKTKCADCNGSGDGEKYTVKCYTCGGNGKVQLDCNNCHGMGWVYAGLTPTSCMHCNGTGKGETPDCPLCKNGISTRSTRVSIRNILHMFNKRER